MDNTLFDQITCEFTLTDNQLKIIANDFQKEIKNGLTKGKKSSLKMLKSYISLPTGNEKGDYLALDFGGTNLRVLLIRLLGQGKFEILKKVDRPLFVKGKYDFISNKSNADELFEFIAKMVEEAIDGDTKKNYLLGHTFSFPSSQTTLNNARLIIWTKEFATRGVEGKQVNLLLQNALNKIGLSNVNPVAVINDTVAVLLASAYKNHGVQIGGIYATGYNTCYFEKNIGKNGMIINLESGGFNNLKTNIFDKILDKNSTLPNEQRMEKMVSGKYMGELLTICIKKAWQVDIISFNSIDISYILIDNLDDMTNTIRIFYLKSKQLISKEEARFIRDIAMAIVRRSTQIVASSYVGILWHIFKNKPIRNQTIAIDGSVFEKMPFVQEYLAENIATVLPKDAKNIKFVLENGGSALGAAIAACNANKKNENPAT